MAGLQEVLARPCAWLASVSDASVVVSSRIRLARNLRDGFFPDWAGPERRVALWREVRPKLERLEPLEAAFSFGMEELDELQSRLLFERHLISRDMLEREGAGVVISHDEHLSVMVNEEDHFRIQCMYPGLRLHEAWERMDRVDNAIEDIMPYAYSNEWGYLTACPTNLGTAMRAGVMLHTPGLVFSGDMGAIINGLGKIGLAVRGLWGEGTEAVGNMFQVSNQMSMGWSEAFLVDRLHRIVCEIETQERYARARLIESRPHVLLDRIGRAVGILSHAHVLPSKEALDLLSALRLGLDLGMVRMDDVQAPLDLLLRVQPAHLQKDAGRPLSPTERDVARAELIRMRLGGLRVLKRRRRARSKEKTNDE